MSHSMLEVLEHLIARTPDLNLAGDPDIISVVEESRQDTDFMIHFLNSFKEHLKKLCESLDQQTIEETMKTLEQSDSIDLELESVASELIESIDEALKIVNKAKKEGFKDAWKKVPVDIFAECTGLD